MGDLNLIEILIYTLNFIVTCGLLYFLLYRPVSKFLAARRTRIADALRDAEERKGEAEAVLNEAKAELVSSGEQARKISHEAIETAALDAERILDNAQEEADAILARAREQLKNERLAAQERALTEVVSLAGELASRILSREIGIDDNRAIADKFFQEKADQAGEHDVPGEEGSRP